MKSTLRHLIFMLTASTMLALMASSCGTARHTTARQSYKSDAPAPSVPAPPRHIDFANLKLSSVSEKLLREADSWIGTPYTYGGNDRKGVDCSGFVTQVFRNSVGLSLPRTSKEQQSYCLNIERGELIPGDLVFFTVGGGSDVGHVGIYIGQDQIVHASSSKGVIISSLNANYYSSNYYSSGRVEKFFAMTKPEVPLQDMASSTPDAEKERIHRKAEARVRRIANPAPAEPENTTEEIAPAELSDFFD